MGYESRKWTYCDILIYRSDFGKEKVKYLDNMSLSEYLNNLGKQGWELVSVTPITESALQIAKPETSCLIYTFKRPAW